jgi:hypothetical protein
MNFSIILCVILIFKCHSVSFYALLHCSVASICSSHISHVLRTAWFVVTVMHFRHSFYASFCDLRVLLFCLLPWVPFVVLFLQLRLVVKVFFILSLHSFTPYRSTRSAPSVSPNRPSVTHGTQISNRSFYHYAPVLWNSLPPNGVSYGCEQQCIH